jgi:outer membrane protein OmpA-like peptidoglycan-associated protein
MSNARPARGSLADGGTELQRKCACGGSCTDCRSANPANPRAQRGALESAAVPSIARQARRTPGHALDTETRHYMEVRFGHDFGRVRIHDDTDSAEAAGAVAAQAYTLGHDIFFAPHTYAPRSSSGLELLAHELAHVVQQGEPAGDDVHMAAAGSRHESQADQSARAVAAGRHTPALDATRPSVQRKLVVDSTSGFTGAAGQQPGSPAVADPAASLTPFERLDMMDHVISGLCPDFKVMKGTPPPLKSGAAAASLGSGEVVSKTGASLAPDRLAGGSDATGCCCLNVLTNAPNTWTIHVSQLVSPFTSGSDIVLPSSNTPVEFGSYTAAGSLAFQGLIPVAGHELCGHAALIQVGAHPAAVDRTTSDVHDPTVNIENSIAREQGTPVADLRGRAASGPHRGESVDRLTVSGFPGNVSDVAGLPMGEQAKLQFAAAYIRQNNTFADVIGHSDASEAAASNSSPDVSEKRALHVQSSLETQGGVTPKFAPAGMPASVDRFTRVDGVQASAPLQSGSLPSSAAERRVDVLMPIFAAGAQIPPSTTPARVDPVPMSNRARTLRAGGNPCEQKLVGSAYPKASKP